MTSNPQSTYDARGVSATKEQVHEAIAKMDKGLFPGAFCTIHPDYLGGDERYANIQHADGAGTKASLAYLVWKLTGNLDVWRGIVSDSLYMNYDDLVCAGALGPFLVSMTLGRNKALIPGEVIKVIIDECQAVCDMLTKLGITCIFTGGETADIGDLVRTIVVDNTITVRFPRAHVINAANIKAPGLIVGFSTTGKATWEDKPNSGIGSNGLTNARHDTLFPTYRVFTETYAPETDCDLIYCGKYDLRDLLPGDSSFAIRDALLSPTRTYLPLVQRLFAEVGRENILGLIHCSGGGQTKIGKFGQPGNVYVKDRLFSVPPLFAMLKDVRNLPWREMYACYNMGHRLEVVVLSKDIATQCIAIAGSCGIEAQIVGYVGQTASTDNREVRIKDPTGQWHEYKFAT